MTDFMKYLAPGEQDRYWGFFLHVAGSSRVGPNRPYPSAQHPSGYHFNWEQGRLLQEFQLNYISQGKGVLENKQGQFPVQAGSILLIRPNCWHRYRPDLLSGWTEHYVGFSGSIAEHLLSSPPFAGKPPVFHPGMREEIIDSYLKIFELIKGEHPGYQQIASAMVIKILGYLVAFEKEKAFKGKRIVSIIQQARFQMRQEVENPISPETIAGKLNVGYSYFRRIFRQYTGFSPHEYQLELQLMRAKELLLANEKSIKEIGFQLGFQSPTYFTRFFKKHTGLSPGQWKQGRAKGQPQGGRRRMKDEK